MQLTKFRKFRLFGAPLKTLQNPVCLQQFPAQAQKRGIFFRNKKEQKPVEEKPKNSKPTQDGEIDSDEEFTVKAKDIKKLIREQDQEIDDLKQEFYEAVEMYRSQVGDNDKTVKQYKQEVEAAKEEALAKFAKEVLSIRDNLELALKNAEKSNIKEQQDITTAKKEFIDLLKGVQVTTDAFDKTMQKFKIEQFNPLEEKFDPQLHEALGMVNDPTKPPNTVCMVMETGWRIGNRVLRAAKVMCVANKQS
jgi:molecular chaperone GrpE